LIELMVSIVIGLLIITALLAIYVNSNSASKSSQNTSELVNNGRYAMDLIKSDLRQAGFKGYTWAPPDPLDKALSTVITPISNECLQNNTAAAGSFVANIWQGVWGADDTNPFSAGGNCLTAYARGDILVVRRVSPSPVSALAPGTFYFRSNYASGEVFRGAPITACDTTQFPSSNYPSPYNKYPCITGKAGVDLRDFSLVINVYYIRSYSVSASENPLVPALVRVYLRSDGSMASEMVASGIENLQVQYGRTLSDLTTRFDNASSLTGTSYLTATSNQDWADVNSVRVWLLSRNASKEQGFSGSVTYSMGNATVTAADGYRRQVFNSIVELRN
jgi:type IV pilus assembly protein PilW